MINICCQYCDGEVRSEDWGAFTCQSCGSVMVKFPPSRHDLTNFYTAKFLDSYHGGGREHESLKRQSLWGRAYYRELFKISKKGSLIDIGSANNPFPNIAAQNGFSVTVLDFKKPPLLDHKITFISGSLNEDHKDSYQNIRGKFDVVSSWAVIEHCLYTVQAIEAMISLCKVGGYIILTTPEIGTIAEKYGAGRTPWFYPPEHIYLVSRKALRILFEERGCSYVEGKKFEYNLVRWLFRYGLTATEGIVGIILRIFLPSLWSRLRNIRLTKATGITLIVFKKL